MLLSGKRILVTGMLTAASLPFAVARQEQADGAGSLLYRATARGAPARRVWITPEFVADRLGPRPQGEVRRRAVWFGPVRMVGAR